MDTLSLLTKARQSTSRNSMQAQRVAILLSLAMGFVMFAGKTYAYVITGSAAILSDAAESVVHVFAVGFAAFSLWLSQRPADRSHPYGHEKIAFVSAGMEGALIVVAAGYIIYEAVVKWLAGLAVQNLSTGTFFVAGAAVLNAGLGFYLLSEGKRSGSLILIANGRHVLTDVWTSAGVVVGLILTLVTGVLPLDPCVAILVAINILWSGGKLIRQSVGGLMDEGDPALEAAIKNTLDEETHEHGLRYHQLRYRNSGTSLWVELHLLFPAGALLEDAHRSATAIERAVSRRLSMPVHIVTHLEPQDQHDQAHVESPHM